MTLERNAHLPPTFDYGETNNFHTPDLHTFTFVLAPSQSVRGKYEARIRAMDGVALPNHVGTLPLVDGEHLESPARGVIDIDAPDCPTALVLDYRNSRRPKLERRPGLLPRAVARARCAGDGLRRPVADALARAESGSEAARIRRRSAGNRRATLRHHVPLPENAARYWFLLEVCVLTLALRLVTPSRSTRRSSESTRP